MAKIKILADEEARKVAAGEVVERPVNIVKELVENSLDAQASVIAIHIEKAGKQLIRVVDDGCGMSVEDAKLSVISHATSKITSIHDLQQVKTFGFRGEALASIAAVSDFLLKTKENISGEKLGAVISVAYGESSVCEQKPCAQGTEISVANLFDNIPVRKKFLKQDETEWNHILQLVQATALSNKNVYFKLFHGGKLMLNLPPVNDVKKRITQIWGYNLSENLTMLLDKERKGQHEWLQISGYISNHNFWRYNRNSMFFFVNNRWVKHQELSRALLKGYLNVLPPARFPAACIFIEVDRKYVDVNVHPKKEEVRFIHPGIVQKNLQRKVKETLELFLSSQVMLHQVNKEESNKEDSVGEFDQFIKPAGTFDQGKNAAMVDAVPSSDGRNFSFSSFSVHGSPLKSLDFSKEYKGQQSPVLVSTDFERDTGEVQQKSFSQIQELQGSVIGQLFNTYILLDQADKLVIIDQHAAHERILYERFRINFGNSEGTKLLFPLVVSLQDGEIPMLLKHKELFGKYGIDVDQIGSREIVVKSTPSGLRADSSIKELIRETIDFLYSNNELEDIILHKKLAEHMHSQMACKAAVKAGDKLTLEQIKQLLKDLSLTNNCFICAHGRPTTWSVAKRDIEKNFKRC